MESTNKQALMTNLVWDESRVEELADQLRWATVCYLEQFNLNVDAFKVAHEVEMAVTNIMNFNTLA